MSAPRAPDGGGMIGRVTRAVVAPVISGSVAAIVFLVMIQGSFHKGYTTLDFNHVLGTLIEGGAREVGSTTDALGVVGDSVGPTGLRATILLGIALMVVHELAIAPYLRRHWLIQAIPLAVLTNVAVGFVFCGLASARFDTPTGLFGVDAGGATPMVIVLCSIGFALMGARIHELARHAAWWKARPDPLADTDLEHVAGLKRPD